MRRDLQDLEKKVSGYENPRKDKLRTFEGQEKNNIASFSGVVDNQEETLRSVA